MEASQDSGEKVWMMIQADQRRGGNSCRSHSHTEGHKMLVIVRSVRAQIVVRAAAVDDVDNARTEACYLLWWDVVHIVGQLTLSSVLPYNAVVVDSSQANSVHLLGYMAKYARLLACADDLFLTSCGSSVQPTGTSGKAKEFSGRYQGDVASIALAWMLNIDRDIRVRHYFVEDAGPASDHLRDWDAVSGEVQSKNPQWGRGCAPG